MWYNIIVNINYMEDQYKIIFEKLEKEEVCDISYEEMNEIQKLADFIMEVKQTEQTPVFTTT